MISLTFYYVPDSPECQAVDALLEKLKSELDFQITRIDISQKDPALLHSIGGRVPVIQVGPYRLTDPINEVQIRVAVGAARDRQVQMQKIGQQEWEDKVQRGRTVTQADYFSLWLSKNYIHVFNLLIFLYVGLPFLAPVLMKNGYERPASLIYRFYSFTCHQLPFRSWFLFGQQAYYPRELSGISGVITYEQAIGIENLFEARNFNGNPVVGYKVALCQRDVAIYLAMLGFGVVFALRGRRIKGIPWYLWVILGLFPIGIDGTSQLFGLVPNMPAWLPLRESTPFLRTVTGALFGLMTVWYLYPLIEQTMEDTYNLITRKIERTSQNPAPESGEPR